MNINHSTPTMQTEGPSDVFTAARWFDDLWNSSAKAVAHDSVEWHCNTWGSGRGHGDWTDTAIFLLVAAVFELSTTRNYDGRDELVICVPVDKVPEIVALIDRSGDYPEMWPWLQAENEERQLAIAADILRLPAAAIAENEDLMEALRLL